MTSGIYRLEVPTPTGIWIYVGSSRDIESRFRWDHLSDLRSRTHSNPHLQRLWDKYHEINLVIIEECSSVDLLLREQIWLDRLSRDQHLLNVNLRADRPPSTLGQKRLPESLSRMREAHLGHRHTIESRASMSVSHTGLKQSQETIARRVEKNIGKKRTQETRDKMSKSRLEYFRRKKEAIDINSLNQSDSDYQTNL